MSWSKKFTEKIADTLRFGAYLFLALDVILFSVFLFWFITRFIWRLAQYINYHWFQNEWF